MNYGLDVRVTQESSRLTGRAVSALSLAALAILCDAGVALTAYIDWQSFDAAPKNESLVAGDDPTFFVAGLAYAASSAVRYLVLAALIVTLVLCRVTRTSPVMVASARSRGLIAGLLITADVGYVAATWAESNPGQGWYLMRVTTLAISALLSAATMAVIFRRTNRAR